MSPDLEIVQAVMLRYAELYKEKYSARWIPTHENINKTLELLKPPMPGFEALSKEDLIARVNFFFKCKEDWLLSCKYNFSVFILHIHRWVNTYPAQHPVAASAPQRDAPYKCPECQNELSMPSEICEKCFPHCNECGLQHLKTESCTEFAERDRKLRELFSKQQPRGGPIKTISGENAFKKEDKK